jgi:hypothetical protein
MELQIHQFHAIHGSPMIAFSHLPGEATMTVDTLIKDREVLIGRCIPFLEEVKNIAAGTAVENWLNQKYGPRASSTTPGLAGSHQRPESRGGAATADLPSLRSDLYSDAPQE